MTKLAFLKTCSFFLFCLFALPGIQAQQVERLMPPVTIDGTELSMGFAGGLNSPQLSAADLNNDGIADLHIFDRTVEIHLTFLNQGTPGEPDYIFAPEYAANFPDSRNYVLLRDYNGDGIADMFSHFDNPVKGMQAYTGYYDNENRLAFEPFQFCCEQYNIMYFPLPSAPGDPVFYTNIFIGDDDYPDMVDVDGDDDLDLLTWSPGGGFLEWYRNISVEEGYGLDSLLFKREDNCWGKFYESSFSEEITLSDDPDECASPFTNDPVDARHAGSTTMALDMNNDGALEVVIGDIISPHLNMLENAGTAEDAYMNDQNLSWLGIEIPSFVSSFYLDLNNDGLKDLVAAPNDINVTENYNVIWWHQNVGTAEFPEFEFVQKDFLVEDMLDFGAGSNPCFIDYNADGLKDILIGTDGYYVPGVGRDPRLVLLENVGTSSTPAFELIDDDYLEMSQFGPLGSWNFTPTVGDLDNDGDLDLVVGEREGFLYYFENNGGSGNPVNFGTPLTGWQGIDITLNAAPDIVDLNRDGKPDLVVGDRNGFFYYFQNIGTPSEPAFNPDPEQAPNNGFLGNVTTELPQNFSEANSAPVFLDFGDEFLLFAGTQVGPVQVYNNIDGNLDGTFNQLYANFGDVMEGTRSKPALTDLDSDGFYELLVGNRRGGLSLFSTNLSTEGSVSALEVPTDLSVQVQPNPSGDGRFTIELPELSDYDAVSLEVYDATGRLLQTDKGFGHTIELHLKRSLAGLYFCRITAGSRTGTVRLVVVE